MLASIRFFACWIRSIRRKAGNDSRIGSRPCLFLEVRKRHGLEPILESLPALRRIDRIQQAKNRIDASIAIHEPTYVSKAPSFFVAVGNLPIPAPTTSSATVT